MNVGMRAVSKEEAIKIIMNAPGDTIFIGCIKSLNGENIYKKNRKCNKEKGIVVIQKSKEIGYQDNDFFGTFLLYGITDKSITHNILFPQSGSMNV